MGRPRGRSSGPREFTKADRISEVVREVVARELERIGDERLDLVTITGVKVDGDLGRARVYYSALMATDAGTDGDVDEALEDHRRKIQSLLNRVVRTRKVPQIQLERDEVLLQALHIESVLQGLRNEESNAASADEPDTLTD